ncbi:MFS general substrate transporter [Hygrophoropsis aurantiaca]|uniref:MFS general substrate transporter n=1 Tax=Hygrophoropsis aurantiaca TaxID=72124 RepID=A0ACB8ABU8_9AGAM|nr:MFS general substrate transporter [Hygrophoropsis aurantiaca]
MSLSSARSDIAPIDSFSDEKKASLDNDLTTPTPVLGSTASTKPKLPIAWQAVMVFLTCMCTFGNHWSNGLIIALKTTIETNLKINNSEFATLVAVTNLMNTFLCVGVGFLIDRFGGASSSVVLAAFHFAGSIVQAGATTNGYDNYPLLVAGKVIAAVGDGSLDNAQHKIFTTYFAPGKGFAFSIGLIWAMANLAQFTGQATANVMATDLGSYAWPLWISAVISLLSLLCAIGVSLLDKYLHARYDIVDHSRRPDQRKISAKKMPTFHWPAVRRLPLTFWILVLFAIFENAGVQAFVSISTQFAQQRLQSGAVIGGWVSSMYLLLPVALTPFLGVFIDAYGHRVTLLFMSGMLFLISMLFLRLSGTVTSFIVAYVFYALSQSFTPAPQVEIVRSIIPDPHYYGLAFAIKKSIVQASIVIIVTVAGKLQDESPTSSLMNPVIMWLAYSAISVVAAGILLIACYTKVGKRLLPAARLSQVRPRDLAEEVDKLWNSTRATREHQSVDLERTQSDDGTNALLTNKRKEVIMKSPMDSSTSLYARWAAIIMGALVVVIGWAIFGLGVEWGVHGNIIAGTVGT